MRCGFFPLSLKTKTHDGSPSLLDPDAFPSIISRIIAESDHDTRLALWSVNRALRERLTAFFYYHFVSGDIPFATSDGTSINSVPFLDGPVFSNLQRVQRHCRILEIAHYKPIVTGFAAFAVDAAHKATTLRVPADVDVAKLEQFGPLPPTLVLNADFLTGPEDTAQGPGQCITPPALPNGIQRVVLNVAYCLPESLPLASIAPNFILPDSIKEFVVHFKHGHPLKRPQYVLLRGSMVVKFLSISDPAPMLQSGQSIDLFPRLVHPGPDIFAQLADLYATAIGKGKRKNRALKLTLVGADEFDGARKADEADDDTFAAMIHTLPWGRRGTPTPSQYRLPYTPIGPRFVDMVVDMVHKSKHDRVRKYVRVLSSAEYLAELDDKRRYEENWWRIG